MARPCLTRRLGAAALLTALVLTSAACGDDATTATDEASSGEGSSSTEESQDPEASAELEELAAEDFYPAVMAAMQDAGSMGFATTTTGGPAPTEVEGVMAYGADSITMQASSTGAQAFEMVMLDKLLYIAGEGFPLPDGKKWLKVDLSDPESLFGQLGKATDPSLMFKAMDTPKEFELVGSEEVDGVETNHYRAVLDTAAYAEAMDMPDEMAELMPEDMAIDMWVDADNQPRKFVQELEIPDPTGSGQPTTTTTEGTYFDFGTAVDVEAPPADEVADNIPGLG